VSVDIFKRMEEERSEIKDCDWCDQPSRNTRDGLCGTCQMISTPVLGLRPSQVPKPRELEQFNSYIHSSRILPDEERLLGLRNVISADDIPPPFRPRSRLNWPIESATKWKELRISLDDGDVPHDLSLPLPLGSTLEISECGKEMSISQGWRKKPVILPNAPPLADIARLLEDPEKAREIRYWDKFIMALSASVRSLGEGDNLSGGWFKRNGWSGIDTPNAEGALRFEIFGKDPAAFVFLTMLFDDFDPEENYVGSLLRENLDAFMWMGNIGWEWISVFEGEVGQREKMFGTDVHPRLVNFQNKLHIIILRNGVPTPIPVPFDSRLLTSLVTIVLRPCNTHSHRFLDALFWIFDSELETWVPSEQDIKGAKLLRSVVDGLGDRSSYEPIHLDHNQTTGIFVQGDSEMGLCYCISPSRTYGKMEVHVALDPNDLRWDFCSQDICIDLSHPESCVPADHALSYLLALANDSHTRERINTLDVLMSCAESCMERVPGHLDETGVWSFVRYCFSHDFDADYDDYYSQYESIMDPEFMIDLPDPPVHGLDCSEEDST